MIIDFLDKNSFKQMYFRLVQNILYLLQRKCDYLAKPLNAVDSPKKIKKSWQEHFFPAYLQLVSQYQESALPLQLSKYDNLSKHYFFFY